MKRTTLYILLMLLAACGTKQTEQPAEPSALEQEMAALYGENKVINGIYPDSLAVEVDNGIFVGQRDSNLLAFKGVPYALQPTGDRRWQVAKPEPDSRLVREAKYFGHTSIQSRSQHNAASLYPQGEDCLTLNIWTAADGMRTARRPVMVWVHGGSYVCNGTANPRDWCDKFVKAHPEVVMVSINYRLGLLGFLDLSSLPDGQAFACSGVLGILDQVEALRWVKRNIAAFGGDPGNVTLVGHSAGAGSVSLLASINEAQGLFRRIIAQSGSVAFTSSREDCQSLTKRVLDATGAKTVAELQALSTDDIIALNDEVGEFFRFPERDGVVIPEDPYSRFNGFNAGIDMLIGSNSDEARYWIDAMGGEENFDMATQLWYRYISMSLDSLQREKASRFIDVVPKDNPWPVAELLNDLMFRGPAIEMAQRHAAAGGRTYMYYWTKALKDPIYGACHGSEVAYVLNTGRQIKMGDDHNPALAAEVQQMWVNFATTGNPSTPAHYWPAYEATQRATMVLGDTIKLLNDPLSEQRRLIAPLMSEYISPVFSDLLDKAPWYVGAAIAALVILLLLLTWLIVKVRRRFRKRKQQVQQ
ncbi:MAG: carboxylesterase/lipase family protein [Muribaculaceae bacterium]|nr:carboxylesterase/lipase family protein [Muribaculaceae bacterium]